MTREIIIIALIIALIYLYYQNRKLKGLPNLDNSPKTIYELDEDLITDKDEAIRKKNEAEQEALSLGNKLKLKNQEVSRKDQEIKRLKQEKKEFEELKKKYSKQGQLLDNEQLENNQLTEKIEKLEEQSQKLKQEHQAQLKAINILFDPPAKDYPTIEFAGLYSLLEKLAKHK